MEYQIYRGDVIEVLKDIPDETYTCAFTDPPYGLGAMPDMAELLTYWLSGEEYNTGPGFMGKNWDVVPGPAVWREVYRVCKPGAVLMAFGGTRTEDLLSMAIRLAGWERFDRVEYLYGSGFPKSTAIDKQIDKTAKVDCPQCGGTGNITVEYEPFTQSFEEWYADTKDWGGTREEWEKLRRVPNISTSMCNHCRGAGWVQGAEREVVGVDPIRMGRLKNQVNGSTSTGGQWEHGPREVNITAPATPAAATWAGYGTSLKPAHESILLFRKPRTKTYAQHAVEDGTGALWVDGTRVATEAGELTPRNNKPGPNGWKNSSGGYVEPSPLGRWPSNIIWDGSDEVAEVFARAGEVKSKRWKGDPDDGYAGTAARFFQVCPQDHPDAARFFYASKASRRERNAGLEGMPIVEAKRTQAGGDDTRGRPLPRNRNHHPCIKPLPLCEYLSRLILPPVEYREDACLLVPFCGSGSEMVGALLAGWLNIDGIDKDEDEHGNPLGYVEIARRRLDWWSLMKRQTRLSDPAEILARVYPQDVEETNDDPAFADLPLFAELS